MLARCTQLFAFTRRAGDYLKTFCSCLFVSTWSARKTTAAHSSVCATGPGTVTPWSIVAALALQLDLNWVFWRYNRCLHPAECVTVASWPQNTLFFFTFSIAFPKRWRWKDGLLQLNSRGGTWTVARAADLSAVLVIPHRIAVIIILALMRPRRTLQFYNHYNLLNSTT